MIHIADKLKIQGLKNRSLIVPARAKLWKSLVGAELLANSLGVGIAFGVGYDAPASQYSVLWILHGYELIIKALYIPISLFQLSNHSSTDNFFF